MKQSHIQEELLNMFLYMGSEWVLHLLAVLSIVSVGIALERLVHFWLRREDLGQLKELVDRHLGEDDIDAARDALRQSVARLQKLRVGLMGVVLNAAFEDNGYYYYQYEPDEPAASGAARSMVARLKRRRAG